MSESSIVKLKKLLHLLNENYETQNALKENWMRVSKHSDKGTKELHRSVFTGKNGKKNTLGLEFLDPFSGSLKWVLQKIHNQIIMHDS